MAGIAGRLLALPCYCGRLLAGAEAGIALLLRAAAVCANCYVVATMTTHGRSRFADEPAREGDDDGTARPDALPASE